MKTLSDSQLKIATVFDLTEDLDLIKDATGLTPELKDGLSSFENGRISSMIEFAEYTKDKELLKRLELIFSEELANFFNE